MKHAPTVAKHRTIDPARTKRHMLKSTPDMRVFRIPMTTKEEQEYQREIHVWITNWSELHHWASPYVTITGTDDYYRRVEVRAKR